jgi:hypothetical protein
MKRFHLIIALAGCVFLAPNVDAAASEVLYASLFGLPGNVAIYDSAGATVGGNAVKDF